MAHFVRPLVLAQALDPDRYEVHFHAPSRYLQYLRNRTFEVGELATMPGEQFLANIARGAPLFPAKVLRGYVEQERRLFAQIRPALVIGDLRLSLPVSAKLAALRHAVLVNAYWSPYARRRTLLPSIPVTRYISPTLLLPLFRRIEPMIYAIHVAPSNRVRKHYGMPALAPDIRAMYTDADYVLYADVPEFAPCYDLPGNHRYLGVCDWAAPAAKPEWWDEMQADPKPKIFVAMGSSGSLEVMPRLVRVLGDMQVSVLLATSGRQVPSPGGSTHVADLLPFVATARESRVVVCNGGSGSVYPAIAAGTPVLGIPANADQQLSTALLEESGAGLGVRIENASEKNLRAALDQLLLEPRYGARAREWSAVFRRYDAPSRFREFVAEAAAS